MTRASCRRLLTLCLIALALSGCTPRQGPSSPEELLGQPLPAMELTPWFHDHPARVGDGHTWVVLELWAHWCEPCLASLQVLAPWAANRPEVDLLAVNIQRDEEVGDREAARFSEAAGGAPVLYRGGPAARRALGADAVPLMLLIDPSGIVRATHRGRIDPETLKTWETYLH